MVVEDIGEIIGNKERMKSKPAFKAFGQYYYLWNYERLSATVDIGEEFPKELIRKRILKKMLRWMLILEK